MQRTRFNGRGAAVSAVGWWVLACAAAFVVGCGHLGGIAPALGPSAAGRSGISSRPFDVPPHVRTWTDADHTRPWLDWSTVTPYLDYAIVGQGTHDIALAQQIHAAGIAVVEYTEPNRQAGSGAHHFPYDMPGDYAYDCGGDRIYRVGFGSATPPPGPPPTPPDHAIYLMDPHSAHLASSWAAEVTAFAQSAGSPAYVFEDTADSVANMDTTPCGFDQTDWSAAANALDATMAADAAAQGDDVALIFNGLAAPYSPAPDWVPPATALTATASGGMAEDCYSRQPPLTRAHPDPTPVPVTDAAWMVTENVESFMAAAQKTFICNAKSDLTSDADVLTALRTYVDASFLLTYDPSTSVLDEQFRPVSSFSVFPESGIVALEPLLPEPTQIADLLAGGVYARQYAACYAATVPIGPCAAVVNPSTTATYAFPFPGVYQGFVKLKGGGVLDRGAAIKLMIGVPGKLKPASATIAYGSAAPSPSPSPSPQPSPSEGPAATR